MPGHLKEHGFKWLGNAVKLIDFLYLCVLFRTVNGLGKLYG